MFRNGDYVTSVYYSYALRTWCMEEAIVMVADLLLVNGIQTQLRLGRPGARYFHVYVNEAYITRQEAELIWALYDLLKVTE